MARVAGVAQSGLDGMALPARRRDAEFALDNAAIANFGPGSVLRRIMGTACLFTLRLTGSRIEFASCLRTI